MVSAQTPVVDRPAAPAAAEAAALEQFDERVREIATSMVELTREGVPGYGGFRDPAFATAAQAHCEQHVRAFVVVAREQRLLAGSELDFVRLHAELRARQGVPLDLLLHAYRMGHSAIFSWIVELCGPTPAGTKAALSLTRSTLAHVDVISTTFTEAYLAEERRIAADTERATRELVEHALAGTLDDAHVRAGSHALRFEPADGYAVVIVSGPALGPDELAGACAALATGAGGRRAHAIVRAAEVIALVPAGHADGAALRELVEAAVAAAGPHARAGASRSWFELARLGHACAEARSALAAGGPARVGSLRELTLPAYLARTADPVARALVDERLAAAIAGDRERGGRQLATLAAYLEASLNANAAARALFVHPNTVHYRLRRLAEAAGRDPRRIADLIEIWLVAQLLDRDA